MMFNCFMLFNWCISWHLMGLFPRFLPWSRHKLPPVRSQVGGPHCLHLLWLRLRGGHQMSWVRFHLSSEHVVNHNSRCKRLVYRHYSINDNVKVFSLTFLVHTLMASAVIKIRWKQPSTCGWAHHYPLTWIMDYLLKTEKGEKKKQRNT